MPVANCGSVASNSARNHAWHACGFGVLFVMSRTWWPTPATSGSELAGAAGLAKEMRSYNFSGSLRSSALARRCTKRRSECSAIVPRSVVPVFKWKVKI
jgi:hypothetical protein